MADESQPAEPNNEPIATETAPTPDEAVQNTTEETPAAEAAPSLPSEQPTEPSTTQIQEPASSEQVQHEVQPEVQPEVPPEAPQEAQQGAPQEVSADVPIEPSGTQIEGRVSLVEVEGRLPSELPQEGSAPETEQPPKVQKKDRVTIDVPESLAAVTEDTEGDETAHPTPDLRRVGSAVGRTTSSDLRSISKSGSLTAIGEGIDARKSKSSLGGMRDQELTRSKLFDRAKLVVGSVISVRALSTDRIVFDKKGPRYMNTYKLWSDNPFNPEKVQKILETVMTETMEHLCYEPELCAEKAKYAAADIRQRVKDLEFDRYKIISAVTIGEKNSQEVTVRSLWDVERDRYAFFTIESTNIFGIAQCYGIYYE